MRSSFARTLLTLPLLALPFIATAQIKVVFPGNGIWEAWIGPGSPDSRSVFKSKGESVSLPLAGTHNEDRVTVYDGTAGNLAYRTLTDIDDTWTVKGRDFSEIASVIIEVTHKGAPVAAANVSLKTSKRTQTLLLTPSHKGRLTFKGVAAGKAEVLVSTSKDGQPVSVPTQGFELKLVRQAKVPILKVALAEPVDTVGAVVQAPAASAANVAPTPPWYRFLQMLLGLGAIAGLAYLAWRHLPGMKPKIDEQLAKVGVQIPADPVPDDAPSIPVAPAPIPVEQIILANSDPASVSTPTPIIAQPALVGPAGRFDIAEGTTLVTREEGHGLYIDSTTVSRKHAEIIRDATTTTLKDLGSTNGTFVNGTKIVADTPLKNGDRVQFGDVPFVVEGL